LKRETRNQLRELRQQLTDFALVSSHPLRLANPTFPSSSPWITSVGGTQLAPSSLRDILRNSSREEVTCDSKTGCVVTTGGGFSWRYARPAYQTAAVESYLSRSASAGAADSPALTPPLDGSWFNTSGRGYPDISVAATNFEIFLAGRATQIGGTSASSPTVAAMVSLWNEKLRLEGKPPMGFLSE
jgi:tripeptidyl-peptidase-1